MLGARQMVYGMPGFLNDFDGIRRRPSDWDAVHMLRIVSVDDVI